MSDKKVTVNIQNIAGLSMAMLQNDVEHLMFVDNEGVLDMAEYTKLLPVIEGLTKLIVVHADVAARKIQDELLHNIGIHLKEEVGNAVYKAKIPTVETLTMTDSRVELEEEVKGESHHDW